MITKLLLLLVCASTVWSLPRIDGGDSPIEGSRIDEMDEMRANISAIWSEINKISKMVSTHVQDGHHHHSHMHENDNQQHHHHHHGNETQDMSDQIDDHSNHTHEAEHHHDDQHYHQGHPHDEHVDHHQHDDEQRGHHHQHDGQGAHNHHHDEQIGHHHHQDEQRSHHHHHGEQSGHHHHHDDSHEVGSHDGDQVPHVHKPQSHEDSSDEEGSKGNFPYYGNKGYDQHWHRHRPYSHGHHRLHFTNGHHYGSSSWFLNVPDRSDKNGTSGDYTRKRGGISVKSPGIGAQKLELNSQSEENEVVQQAICEMKPNSEISGPRIKGDVKVFQKRYDKGPIYYSLKLKGFSVGKDVRSRTHGFHIHEKALEGVGLCNSAGAHFNPINQTHGSLTSSKRHLGDFGNIIVDKYGTLSEYEFTDSSNRLRDIVGKSMVVHELPDDFGKGGNLESLKTGNAGRRLACCTIYLTTDESIRFNG